VNTKLIILDIDETLLYATESPLNYDCDFMAEHYYVYLRPYVKDFIAFCFQHFSVAIWTSSNGWYAQHIVNNLFDENQILKFSWSRKRCVTKFNAEFYKYFYIKDLKKVKRLGYQLKDIIMIDDSPEKLIRNYGNLVRVSPFVGDIRDEEFLDLMVYLERLKSIPCVRSIEKRDWKNRKV